MEAATFTLCFDPEYVRAYGKERRGPDCGAHELSERNLVPSSMEDHENSQATVAYAVRGIIAGAPTLHYLRWLNTNNRLTLDMAFWTGPIVGVRDTVLVRSLWGDAAHTAATDWWIVFHFHIPVVRLVLDSQVETMGALLSACALNARDWQRKGAVEHFVYQVPA